MLQILVIVYLEICLGGQHSALLKCVAPKVDSTSLLHKTVDTDILCVFMKWLHLNVVAASERSPRQVLIFFFLFLTIPVKTGNQ